jgi:hypothetical protein
VCDAAAGTSGQKATVHGDAGKETLPPDDSAAPEVTLGSVPRQQQQPIEGGQVSGHKGDSLICISASHQESRNGRRIRHGEPGDSRRAAAGILSSPTTVRARRYAKQIQPAVLGANRKGRGQECGVQGESRKGAREGRPPRARMERALACAG